MHKQGSRFFWPWRHRLKRLFTLFDARDACCGVGFLLLYVGLAWRFGHDIALIVLGALILVKVWKPWV